MLFINETHKVFLQHLNSIFSNAKTTFIFGLAGFLMLSSCNTKPDLLNETIVYEFSSDFFQGRTEMQTRFPDKAAVSLDMVDLSREVKRNGEYVIEITFHEDINLNRISIEMPRRHAFLDLEVIHDPDFSNKVVLVFSANDSSLPPTINGVVALDIDNQGFSLPEIEEIVNKVNKLKPPGGVTGMIVLVDGKNDPKGVSGD